MSKEIEVTVQKVLFPKEGVDGDWFILATSKGIAKGNMFWRPNEGEMLILRGKWGEYQGKQEFKFKEAELDIPEDPRALLHYVCTITSGIGEAMETSIWNERGEDWANITEEEIPRFSGRVFQNFSESVERIETERAKSKAVSELMKAGCTLGMACVAWEAWKENTIGVVHENPYRLADLPNYGFSSVDGEIRIYFGIKDDDFRRIESAVIYVIKQITDSGSTLVQWDDLNGQTVKLLRGLNEYIIEVTRGMLMEGTLKGFPEDKTIALITDYMNEKLIFDFINASRKKELLK